MPIRRPRHSLSSTATLLGLAVALAGCASGDLAAPDDSATTAAPSASPSATTSTPESESAPPPADAAANDPGDGVARDTPEPTPSVQADDGRLQATVIITRWGGTDPFEAGGFVQGVVEDGGTCTLTLTHGDIQLKATGAGQASPSGTDCGDGLAISDSRLTGDGWQLVLSYSSQRYSGSSTPQEVSIS